MAIFGTIAAEVIRRERERRLAECIARRRAAGWSEAQAREACQRELDE